MNDFSETYSGLGKRFVEHLRTINNTIELRECEVLWQDIATRYNETPRAYHTLCRLQQLLTQFKKIKHYLNTPDIIALAQFYHDVIYDPTRSDNEEKSAEHASYKLGCYLRADQCERIHALIMMTAMHQLDEGSANDLDNDAAYLLDMDSSILGASLSEYKYYAQAVRQEYIHVTNDAYQNGRIAILENLLKHPRL